MPELPEVEVVRAGLEAHVVGRIITDVEVMHPRPLRRHLAGPEHFAAAVLGHTVLAARRRGKYLWLPLENGDAILAHLGMSGQMLLQRAGAPAERHLRVRFTLSPRAGEAGPPDPDAVELRFVDQRMFGGIALSPGGAALPPEIAHIARDPMDPEFDDARFVAQVRRRTSGVKRLLLDQSLVSGVGNIYADEALWLAGLHGERRGDRLRRADVVAVLAGARTVMAAALAQGGTSFDALYVNVNGESGYFDRSLEVYGREGEPCTRCGSPIVRVPFMNRSSYFCPRCQPPPRARSRSAPTGTGAGSRRGRSGTTRTENNVLPVTSTTRPEREDPGIDPGGAECDSGNTLSIFPRPQPVPRCDPTSSFGGHIWPRRFSDT